MAHTNFDRRRINGPEDSFLPAFDPDEEGLEKWVSGSARVGRKTSDIRPIFLKPGLISQATGSAYIEAEKTKIACAIYGPRQSRSTTYQEKGRLNVEVKFAPFSCKRRRAPMRDAEDRSIAMQVHQALLCSVRLDLFPKSTIDVFLIIVETSSVESCIAAATTAASAALADAGIEMLGLVVACSAALVGEEAWLDPTETETGHALGSVICACMPALDVLANIWQTGRMTAQDTIKCMRMCQERCADIHVVVAQTLLENAKSS